MQYEKLLLEMFERLATLENRVAALENKQEKSWLDDDNIQELKASKKYRFLSRYLQEQDLFSIKLSFVEIENIIQFSLPDSAKKHKEFWANSTSHSIALSWLSIGYRTVEINLDEEYVVFEKNNKIKNVNINNMEEKEMIYESEWKRKKGYLISEIEKVFKDLKNTVDLDCLTYQKQYIGVSINGVNRALIKFRPKKDDFFLEVYDKLHTGNRIEKLQEEGLPIVYLDDPKDPPKMYYYRIQLKDYNEYLNYQDSICELVKYCYRLSIV